MSGGIGLALLERLTTILLFYFKANAAASTTVLFPADCQRVANVRVV